MLRYSFVANKISIDSGTNGSDEDLPLLEPLNARSIVLSVLLGTHPPRMPVGRILDFTSLFDLPDGTVRTALSRMVAAGDLVNDDGVYQLAGRLVERQAQQDAGRREPPSDWDRTWWTVAVVSDRRTMSERREFRTRAVGARLGEVRPDLWLRPANIAIPTDLVGTLITRGPMLAGDEHELVDRLWALDQLRHRAARHLDALDRVARRHPGGDDRSLADTFVTLAAAQQFLRIEPQLPHDLAPDPSAAVLRARYADVVEAFQDELAAFFARRRPGRVRTDGR